MNAAVCLCRAVGGGAAGDYIFCELSIFVQCCYPNISCIDYAVVGLYMIYIMYRWFHIIIVRKKIMDNIYIYI